MIIRQDVSILIEVPEDADIVEAGWLWVQGVMRETDAIDWSCGETLEDSYLP
jgi:hypothetical protein